MSQTLVDIETRYGLLTLDRTTDEKMLRSLESGHYPNTDLIHLAQQFLSPQAVMVDIGAHVGTFSIPMAQRARVIAFEPAPDTFSLLKKNTARAEGIFDLRNKGLAAQPGSAHVVGRNASNAGAQTLAPGGGVIISTLDAEVERADLIKIDVEGMEAEVLAGGADLIDRCKPTVVFEVNLSQLRAHGASPRILQQYFVERNYRLYYPMYRRGRLVLGFVWGATLLTALLAPRAWLMHSDSAPFDLIAVERGRVLPTPVAGFGAVFLHALWHNLKVRGRRIQTLFR